MYYGRLLCVKRKQVSAATNDMRTRPAGALGTLGNGSFPTAINTGQNKQKRTACSAVPGFPRSRIDQCPPTFNNPLAARDSTRISTTAMTT